MSELKKETPRTSKIQLDNQKLPMENDFLYHLGLSKEDNLADRFQDVEYICMGGKPKRMKYFAEVLCNTLGNPPNCEYEVTPNGQNLQLKDISGHAGRYSLFKVGPVLSASHGIGSASMSVVLHELLKLAFYAGCSNVKVIRLGTSGGLGLEPGTVVITNQGYNGLLEPQFRQRACGKEIIYSTKADAELSEKIRTCAESINVKAVLGNTMAADDFYEEQGRVDGALCSFTLDDKMEFLRLAHDKHGIVNIEMESACFIAMCNRTNVKCAVVCVTVVNRLNGDQVTAGESTLHAWEENVLKVVSHFIKLNESGQ